MRGLSRASASTRLIIAAVRRWRRACQRRTPADRGRQQIARFFAESAGAIPGAGIEERTVNGQPGLVVEAGGMTVSVLAFDIAGDRIRHVWAVLNPRKLRPWTPD